jgi:hypothetical protein
MERDAREEADGDTVVDAMPDVLEMRGNPRWEQR